MNQEHINELRAQCHDALCGKHHDIVVDARTLLLLLTELERGIVRPNGVNDATKPDRLPVFDGRLSG